MTASERKQKGSKIDVGALQGLWILCWFLGLSQHGPGLVIQSDAAEPAKTRGGLSQIWTCLTVTGG